MSASKSGDDSGKIGSGPALQPFWIATYFFLILTLGILVRVLLWLVNGGRGAISSSAAWVTDPFVYAFNHSIGLPTFFIGAGKIETGSVVAMALCAVLASLGWVASTRGTGGFARLFQGRSAGEKGGGK